MKFTFLVAYDYCGKNMNGSGRTEAFLFTDEDRMPTFDEIIGWENTIKESNNFDKVGIKNVTKISNSE